MDLPASAKPTPSTSLVYRGAGHLARDQRYLWEHATLLYRSYEWHAALEDFQSLAEVLTGAHRAKCLMNVGLIHARQGEFNYAAASFERATKLSHCLDMSYFLLGVVEYERGNMLKARACFELACENIAGGGVTCTDLRPAHETTESMSLHNIKAVINNAKPSIITSALSLSILGIPPAECIFEVPTGTSQFGPSQARQEAIDLLASRRHHRECKRQDLTQELSLNIIPAAIANKAEQIEQLIARQPQPDIMFEPIREHGADVLKWISAVGRSSSSSSASSRISSLLRFYRKESTTSHSDRESQAASKRSQKSKVSEDHSTPPTSLHNPSFDAHRMSENDLEVDSKTTLWSPIAHGSRGQTNSTDTFELIHKASRLRLNGQDAELPTFSKRARDHSPTRFLLSVERANRLRMDNQDWRMPSKNDKPLRRPPLLRRHSDPDAVLSIDPWAPDPRLDDDGISITRSVKQRDRTEALALLEGRTLTFSEVSRGSLRRYCLYKALPPLPSEAFPEPEPNVELTATVTPDNSSKRGRNLFTRSKGSVTSATTFSGRSERRQRITKKI